MHSIAMDQGRWTTATTYGEIALTGYKKYYGQRAGLVAALLVRLVVHFLLIHKFYWERTRPWHAMNTHHHIQYKYVGPGKVLALPLVLQAERSFHY